MNALNLKEAQYSPKVVLNKKDGIFEISGRSLPEDSEELFAPVLAWFKEYFQSPNPTTIFSIQLQYFNSATAKIIFGLMHTMQSVPGASVEWCYHHDDEDMLEAGQEFESELTVPFTFKAI
jgi:hypothetical protein